MRASLLFILWCFASCLAAQVFTSSNLPLLVIDTDLQTIPDEPKIMARLGIIDNGEGQTNSLTDEFNDYDGWIGIEFRGSTSQTSFPKKGFSIETRTEDGEDIDVSLLGFPAEEDWVLHGPYSDKSLIRNALGYSLAGEMMDYAPRVRLVELFIDNNYQGVYLFTERIKRDNDRVDIAKLDDDEISGDDLTGGYILKFDKFTGENPNVISGFVSDYPADSPKGLDIDILYHYPRPDDIVAEQRDYIQDHLREFENALAGDDFMDPVSGYRPFVDLPSFVDFLIINEVSRNVDGYRLSSYFYKDRDSDGGLLHAGPIWDLNLGFGNANYCDGEQTFGWAFEFNSVCPNDSKQIPFWWRRLRQDPVFLEMLRNRWSELRSGLLATANVMDRIDSFVDLMGEAPDRNYQRWPLALGEYVWPNNFVGDTYPEEIDYLKQWTTDRLNWLDQGFSAITVIDKIEAREMEVVVYPNPSNGPLTIKLSELSDGNVKLKINDISGRPIATYHFPWANDQVTIYPNVPSGYYVLTFTYADGIVQRCNWLMR